MTVGDPAAAAAVGGSVPADGRVRDGHGAVVGDPAAEDGLVPGDGRVRDGHGAVVDDPAAVGGSVPANGRADDSHVAVAVVEDPAAEVDTAPGHGHVLECHREAGTVGEGGAGVVAVEHASGRGARPAAGALDGEARLARATYREVPAACIRVVCKRTYEPCRTRGTT